MATGHMYRKFGEFVRVDFEISEWTHRQTDIHTDSLIAILRTSAVGKVIVRDWLESELNTDLFVEIGDKKDGAQRRRGAGRSGGQQYCTGGGGHVRCRVTSRCVR